MATFIHIFPTNDPGTPRGQTCGSPLEFHRICIRAWLLTEQEDTGPLFQPTTKPECNAALWKRASFLKETWGGLPQPPLPCTPAGPGLPLSGAVAGSYQGRKCAWSSGTDTTAGPSSRAAGRPRTPTPPGPRRQSRTGPSLWGTAGCVRLRSSTRGVTPTSTLGHRGNPAGIPANGVACSSREG